MAVVTKKILVILLMFFATQSAWAIDIHSAKNQGLVGEANTGYLASVSSAPNSEVRALIAEVNAKRKAEFKKTAQKTSTTLSQVQHRFYELAVTRTRPGHYYQDANGNWRKK